MSPRYSNVTISIELSQLRRLRQKYRDTFNFSQWVREKMNDEFQQPTTTTINEEQQPTTTTTKKEQQTDQSPTEIPLKILKRGNKAQ